MANILITGTSSGIGLATAVELATRGERVFASMRDLSRADGLRHALATAHAEATVLQMDVTDPVSVERAVADVIRQAGAVDVLVNNAAIMGIGPLEFTSDEEFHEVFDTNVFGVLRATRAVLPHMRRRGRGRIVNVSSAAAHPRVGVRLWGSYTASKAALHALTLELVKEVAPLGIEVVLVEGGVDANRTAGWAPIQQKATAFAAEPTAYETCERIAAAQMAFVAGNPDRVANVVTMVADACTVAHPPVRYPPEAQQGIDAANRIPDDVFLRLARGDTAEELYESVGGFWPLQRSVLNG